MILISSSYIFRYLFIPPPLNHIKPQSTPPTTPLSLRHGGFHGNLGCTRRPSLHISSQLQRNDVARNLLRPNGQEMGPVGGGLGDRMLFAYACIWMIRFFLIALCGVMFVLRIGRPSREMILDIAAFTRCYMECYCCLVPFYLYTHMFDGIWGGGALLQCLVLEMYIHHI